VEEEIGWFRKAFRELLYKAGVDQLVVPIDDLDRRLPGAAIETLEAVRLFVFTERTAFVVAADEAMIEYPVRKRFPCRDTIHLSTGLAKFEHANPCFIASHHKFVDRLSLMRFSFIALAKVLSRHIE